MKNCINNQNTNENGQHHFSFITFDSGIKLIVYLMSLQKEEDRKQIMSFDYSTVDLMINWEDFDTKFYLQSKEQPFFVITQKEQKFKFSGKMEELQKIRSQCSLKFIFQRPTYLEIIKSVSQQFGLRKNLIKNTFNNNNYIEIVYEKLIWQQSESLQSFTSLDTLDQCIQLPDEIKIIQDCKDCKHMLKIQDILFNKDTFYFSYIYFKTQQYQSFNSILQITLSNPKKIIRYAFQLIQILTLFEDKSIIHTGLIPSNIFLDKTKDHIVLVDYISAIYSNKKVVYNTPGYIVPEDLKQQVTTKSNIYRLGILLYIMLVGQNPFSNANNSLANQNLKFQINTSLLQNKEQNIADLILQLMKKNSSSRPSANQLSKHHIFNSKSFSISFNNQCESIQEIDHFLINDEPKGQQLPQLSKTRQKQK